MAASELRGKIMTISQKNEVLSREEKLVALAHLYLELHLPLQAALDAAAADLMNLDRWELVEEAA
jgi:hypothetical protein